MSVHSFLANKVSRKTLFIVAYTNWSKNNLAEWIKQRGDLIKIFILQQLKLES